MDDDSVLEAEQSDDIGTGAVQDSRWHRRI